MGKKTTPPPPDILRKSGPHKDRSKYDRKRAKQDDKRQAPEKKPTGSRPTDD